MKITIERPDGTKITIEGDSAAEVARQLAPVPLQVGPQFPRPIWVAPPMPAWQPPWPAFLGDGTVITTAVCGTSVPQ